MDDSVAQVIDQGLDRLGSAGSDAPGLPLFLADVLGLRDRTTVRERDAARAVVLREYGSIRLIVQEGGTRLDAMTLGGVAGVYDTRAPSGPCLDTMIAWAVCAKSGDKAQFSDWAERRHYDVTRGEDK